MRNRFRSYDLAVKFYQLTQDLRVPRHLRDQLSRAASSVALNLAEGAARQTEADQKRFFHFAFGSLRECQAVLDLLPFDSKQAAKTADSLAAHIYMLIQNCRGR